MQHRQQRTLRGEIETAGIGFLTGADVTLRFLPAPPDHGISFQRVDCRGSAPIPARIEYAVPRERRTAIAAGGVAVEMIEHVMAALAGLQVDNCLVQLDAPEPPGFDGSCRAMADCLLSVGFVEQEATRQKLVIENTVRAGSQRGGSEIIARSLARRGMAISYHLDYGQHSPILPELLTLEITPETFVSELAFARTFVLESEVQALQAQGYGRRTTAQDLLVFGPDGVIDNELRTPDECVRHKILDCVGDFALLGCDVWGYFNAHRSGHQLNRDIVQRLQMAHPQACTGMKSKAA
jgi:UDP-3-O-acyl N-acetylglucosamine deacetylase